MPPNELADAVATARMLRLSFSGGREEGVRQVPVETPIAIVYGATPYAVMMATPLDLEDFVRGFSLTEGVVVDLDAIRSIAFERDGPGWRASVTLAPEALQTHMARTRRLSGRTGCGVCGIEDIAALPTARRRPAPRAPLSLAAVSRAVRSLDKTLPLGQATRATHGAVWCDAAGRVALVREDVGRHNALDKLVGALVRCNTDPASGFIVITSRCSFEMVEKAVAFGAGALVALSAPTSFALERARLHGLTLLAVARNDGALLFSDQACVDDDLLVEEVAPR